ncbi:VanZ family protein [Streptomyces sp. NPDC059740]|uniref:VanZ family protein n=1 Tax=Streptomyces sp. NPDC059740 TaxID=3346926 RepID=UPI0036554798
MSVLHEGPGGPTAPRLRAAGAVLLAVHLSAVAWLTLRPRSVPWVTEPNLHLFATIETDLSLGPGQAWHSLGPALLLLAPLGVLLPLAGGRLVVSPAASLLRTVMAGALVSLAIAVVQTGVPGRVPDVDVVLLNTAGVALAHLLLVPSGRAWLRRREQGHRGATPRVPRVAVPPRADALSGSRTYL